jgi:hypothetical protein
MIRDKLESASKLPDVTLIIRGRDNILIPILKELEAENYEIWNGDKDLYGTDAALCRNVDMLNKCTHIVIFDDLGGGMMKWWRDKRDIFPYSSIYAHKFTTFTAGTAKKVRHKKGRSME